MQDNIDHDHDDNDDAGDDMISAVVVAWKEKGKKKVIYVSDLFYLKRRKGLTLQKLLARSS